MPITKRIVIVAGEESGDIHAAALIKQLKEAHKNIQISGIGGKHMHAAGAELISDLAQFGVTGITEVIRHLKTLRQAFKAIKNHLEIVKPDLLILVDYPGFNLRLAKYAKDALGLKIIYYISPQIWAWKAKRIHLIKRCVDRMAVILPFEKAIYEQAGVPVDFVGHPLVEKIPSFLDVSGARKQLELPEAAKIIALLPGSRRNEIERHMPILRDTAKILHKQEPNLHFVVPIAGTIKPETIKNYFTNESLPISFMQGKAIDSMIAADFVIVASGTASLECALLGKPMCIIYKTSFITALVARMLVKVKYLGLCNLLANEMIVPEFLQEECKPIELSQYIANFYRDIEQPQKMINRLGELKESLSSKKSDCTLFQLTERELV